MRSDVVRKRALPALGVLVAMVGLAACGEGGGSGRAANTPVKAGQFRLYEWGFSADKPVLKAGRQTITALNTGHHQHELLIVAASDAASLPTQPDGSVDEEALGERRVGEIPDVRTGASKRATFDLAPGSYVVLCNIVDDMGMSGGHMGSGGMASGGMGAGGMQHVHFALGMQTTFVVRAG